MTRFLLAVIACFSVTCTFGQDSSLFRIDSSGIQKGKGKKPGDFKRIGYRFYEDKDFIVSKSCSGEWGGTLTFLEKKTGKEFECSSTCPVMVHRINGKYMVANTLAHMSGFAQVLEIDDPRLLKQVKKPPVKKGASPVKIVPISEVESRSSSGTKNIVDSVGLLVLTSFVFKEKLYYVITDFSKTYIADIAGDGFHTVQLLTDVSIWTYEPETIITKDNHYIVFFKNSRAGGYLDIFENQVKLYTY